MQYPREFALTEAGPSVVDASECDPDGVWYWLMRAAACRRAHIYQTARACLECAREVRAERRA